MKNAKFVLLVVLLVAGVVFADSAFHDPFNNNFGVTWYPATYENNQLYATVCGTTTCGSLVDEGSTKFFRLSLFTTTVAGVYTDTELREEPHDAAIDGGPWTPTLGHPVVFESRVRFDPQHNYDGSGGAVGTSGMGLWNNAAGEGGPNPDYDAIVFSWVDDAFTDAFGADGFTANAVVNVFPVAIARPGQFNLQAWNDIKFVWSVNEQGVQSVEFFLNNSSFGNYTLPTPLQGLNTIVWQDNSVFNDFFQEERLVPPATQTVDIDYVKVYHQN